MIRILIVDDHAVVRKGLAMVLRLEPGFEVVGEAGNGTDALILAQTLHPDVILLDRMMPDMDGGAVARAVKASLPETRILILTGTEVDAEVIEIISAGVDGYVLKEIEPAELKQAIRTLARGEAYLHPAVTRRVLENLTHRSSSGITISLTAREKEVLKWMATNATYREIATRLVVGEETIRSHAKNILKKLGQTSRTQAVLEAARLGLIKKSDSLK